jgi:hypothetical protein
MGSLVNYPLAVGDPARPSGLWTAPVDDRRLRTTVFFSVQPPGPISAKGRIHAFCQRNCRP